MDEKKPVDLDKPWCLTVNGPMNVTPTLHGALEAAAHDLSTAIDEMVNGVASAELRAVEAACYRIVTALGIEAFRTRTERRTSDSSGLGLLAGRAHELAVDGVVIWRGWWEPESGTRSTWRTLWLVEPETLRR